MQLVDVLLQQLLRAVVALVDDLPHFRVYVALRRAGNGGVFGHGMAQKDLAFVFLVGQGPHLFRETPFGHHVSRQEGGPFYVVAGARGHRVFPEDQALGDAPAEQRADLALQKLPGVAQPVLFGQKHGDAQGPPPGDDRHLVHGVVAGRQPPHNGVAGLVVGRELLLIVAHHHGAPFRAHHHLVLGALEFLHVHQFLVRPGREQSGLVDQIGQIRAGKPRRAAGDDVGLHIVGDGHLAHVHLEDLLPSPNVRQRHHHLPVKPPRAQQGRVKHVGPVGGGDDDDAFLALEAIHLHQELI